MKKMSLVTLVAVLIAAAPALGQLMIENFEYAVGDLVAGSGGNWVHISGSGLNIQVVSGSLVYSGYQGSGIGNAIDIVATGGQSAEDVYRQFTTQSPGTELYIAFLVNIPNTTGIPADTSTNGDYFIATLPSTSTTNYADRLCIKKGSTDVNFRLGIRISGTAGNFTAWTPQEYETEVTYLVILRHSLLLGASNDDTVRLWVNPTLSGPEPAPDAMAGTAAGNDPGDLARVAIRQGNSTPSARIDGIVAANTWSQTIGVFGQPPIINPIKFSLNPITPNPLTKATKIQYSLSMPAKVDLEIYNILGQQVATLVNGQQSAGNHSVTWKLQDDRGALVPNGIYFIKLSANGQNITRRAMVVR